MDTITKHLKKELEEMKKNGLYKDERLIYSQQNAQIIINMVDFGMNLQEAGDAPRIVHSGSSQPTDEIMLDGGSLSLEKGFGLKIEQELIRLGHRIKYEKGIFGGYQAIMLQDNVYFGASESRKDGQASGY